MNKLKNISYIIKELRELLEEKSIPNFLSLIVCGSYLTEEYNSKGDIDIQVVFDDYILKNKSLEERIESFSLENIRKTLDKKAQKISKKIKIDVSFWPQSRSLYEGSGSFSGTPNKDVFVLDGWDGLGEAYQRMYLKKTGKTIYGEDLLENLWMKKKINIRDAYELFISETMDMVEGITRDDYKLAKAILRAYDAKIMMERKPPCVIYREVKDMAKGDKFKEVINQAYITKVIAQKNILDKIRFYLKNKQWPRKRLLRKKFLDSCIKFLYMVKNQICEKYDKEISTKNLFNEQVHRERTSFKLIETIFKNKKIHPKMFFLIEEEIFNYIIQTNLEESEKIDVYERKENITNKAIYYAFKQISNLIEKSEKNKRFFFNPIFNKVILKGSAFLFPEENKYAEKIFNMSLKNNEIFPFIAKQELKDLYLEYLLKIKRKKESVEYVRQWIKEYPEDISTLNLVKKVHFWMSNKEVEPILRRIIEKDPEDISAHHLLSEYVSFEEGEKILQTIQRKREMPHTYFLKAWNKASLLGIQKYKDIEKNEIEWETRVKILNEINEDILKGLTLKPSIIQSSLWKNKFNNINNLYLSSLYLFIELNTDLNSALIDAFHKYSSMRDIKEICNFWIEPLKEDSNIFTDEDITLFKDDKKITANYLKAGLYEITSIVLRKETPLFYNFDALLYSHELCKKSIKLWDAEGSEEDKIRSRFNEIIILFKMGRDKRVINKSEKLKQTLAVKKDLYNENIPVILEYLTASSYYYLNNKIKFKESLNRFFEMKDKYEIRSSTQENLDDEKRDVFLEDLVKNGRQNIF